MHLVRIAAGLAVVAAASAAAKPPPRPGEPGYDPDREICKSRPVVGSRVQRVRECHSAAQWEEMMLAERMGLTRAQHNGASGEGQRETYLPPGRAVQQPQ